MTKVTLTEMQQVILEKLQSGLSVAMIASRLKSSPALISAQITRMRKKGVDIPLGPPAPKPTHAFKTSQDIASYAGGDAQAVAAKVGEAMSNKNMALDIHPLAVVGLSIQFMKVMGGRIAAHQAIESVYEAMAMMFGETQKVSDRAIDFTKIDSAIQSLADRVQKLENSI